MLEREDKQSEADGRRKRRYEQEPFYEPVSRWSNSHNPTILRWWPSAYSNPISWGVTTTEKS